MAIAGFGAAARHAAGEIDGRMARVAALRATLETACGLWRRMWRSMRGVARIANTSFFSLPALKAETGHIAFDLEGIALSAGSACASGKVGRSHVLSAMGRDEGQGGLRISIGETTSAAEIGRVLEVFGKIAARRRPAGAAA